MLLALSRLSLDPENITLEYGNLSGLIFIPGADYDGQARDVRSLRNMEQAVCCRSSLLIWSQNGGSFRRRAVFFFSSAAQL